MLSAGLPESLDGADAGLLAQCAVLTEIGRAIAPVPYLEAIVLGAGAVARFGTPEQQRRWAERPAAVNCCWPPRWPSRTAMTRLIPRRQRCPPLKSKQPPRRRLTPQPPPPGGGWLLSGVKTMVARGPGGGLAAGAGGHAGRQRGVPGQRPARPA